MACQRIPGDRSGLASYGVCFQSSILLNLYFQLGAALPCARVSAQRDRLAAGGADLRGKPDGNSLRAIIKTNLDTR